MSNDHVVGQGEPWAESVFHTQSYDGYRVFITAEQIFFKKLF